MRLFLTHNQSCDQYTKVDFLLDSDFKPKLTSISLSFETEAQIQGDLEVYTDSDFGEKVTGLVPVGKHLFVEQTNSNQGILNGDFNVKYFDNSTEALSYIIYDI